MLEERRLVTVGSMQLLRLARLARLRTNPLFDWIFGQRVVRSNSEDWWPRGYLLRVLEVLHGGEF